MSNFSVLDKGKMRMTEDYIYGQNETNDSLLDITNISSLSDASKILANNYNKRANTLVHCDVDYDGVTCGYILKKYFKYTNMGPNSIFTINKERKHGIDQERVTKINNIKPQLVIIVDSSSNELELIRQINCDVIIIDHHEIKLKREELVGKTYSGHDYAIVTNVLDGDLEMSGGMVTYGFMRYFNSKVGLLDNFNDLMLEQWVAMSLFSDVIPCLNERNQYFLSKLFDSKYTEPHIQMIMNSLGLFKMNKNTINFGIVPIVNSAIRAGRSVDVLNTILENPGKIIDIKPIKEEQRKIVASAVDGGNGVRQFDSFVMRELKVGEVPKAYAGLIATKLKDIYQKCAFVYTKEDGILKGSFRGMSPIYDYRGAFESLGIKAMGHRGAFGLEIEETRVPDCINSVCKIDEVDNYYLTLGDNIGTGLGHIDNMVDFKRSSNLFLLANCNNRCTGNEELNIVYSGYIPEPEIIGSLYKYDICGLECISFTPIVGRKALMYVEYQNEIRCYIRNMSN